jgi:hypothetical protein
LISHAHRELDSLKRVDAESAAPLGYPGDNGSRLACLAPPGAPFASTEFLARCAPNLLGRSQAMNTPITAEPTRYDPFTNSPIRRTDEPGTQSERAVPDPVAPVTFRTADQDDRPS